MEKKGVETHQKLYNNGRVKECRRCHQIKPYKDYGARMSLGQKRLFSKCKECRMEINQIYQYNNKLKIIQNLYKGKLKGKYQICSTDVRRLPSLEFHHIDPRLKGLKSFSLYRNWEHTKIQIEKERATVLCVNCLTRSIKKQIIINHLYGGKCVGCCDVTTKENLPALQFHHRDKKNPYKMSKTYVNLRNLEIKEIIEKIKEENCIVLCGNCHRMELSTHFKNNYKSIVNPEHWDQIKKDYEKIEKNIHDFKFEEDCSASAGI